MGRKAKAITEKSIFQMKVALCSCYFLQFCYEKERLSASFCEMVKGLLKMILKAP